MRIPWKTIAIASGAAIVGGTATAATAGVATAAIAGRSRNSKWFANMTVPTLPPGKMQVVPNRGEMFYRRSVHDDPNAPVFVLLHGWLLTADLNWHMVMPALTEVGHIVAPDHRGHGRGMRTAEPFRLQDVADDIIALLDHLRNSAEGNERIGHGPIVLIGYSMGGPIAQLIWKLRPDLVDGIVFAATSSHFQFGPFGRSRWELMFLFQVIARLFPREILDVGTYWRISGELLPGPGAERSDHPAKTATWMVGEMDRGHREDYAEAGRELGRHDARPWLGQIDVPTAVVVTTKDILVLPSAQWELVSGLHRPYVTEIACNHDAPTQVPDQFCDGVLNGVSHILENAGVATTPVATAAAE